MDDSSIDPLEEQRKARKRARYRRYYQRHRERLLKNHGAYRRRNKERDNAWAREHRRKNAAKFRTQARRRRVLRRCIPRSRMKELIWNAKIRAKKRGLEADVAHLERYTLNPPTNCACCRKNLDYKVETTDRSPSLDRIDNRMGYISGNTAIVCWRCNTIKNCGSLENFLDIISYIRRHRLSVWGVDPDSRSVSP